jgi:alpha-beta hydrolase superfamily lysophospholipase
LGALVVSVSRGAKVNSKVISIFALSVSLLSGHNGFAVTCNEPQLREGTSQEGFMNSVSDFENYAATKAYKIQNELNRPFLMHHGYATKNVALMIHGLSDSPLTMRDAGRILFEQGYNVVGILLPGSATSPQEFEKIENFDWDDEWQKEVIKGFAITEGLGENTTLAAYSTGGALAINAAIECPGRVQSMILFAPAVLVANRISVLPEATKKLQQLLANNMIRLRFKKKRITAPTLLIMSEADEVVSPRSLVGFLKYFTGPTSKLVLPRSQGIGHIAMTLPDVNPETDQLKENSSFLAIESAMKSFIQKINQ